METIEVDAKNKNKLVCRLCTYKVTFNSSPKFLLPHGVCVWWRWHTTRTKVEHGKSDVARRRVTVFSSSFSRNTQCRYGFAAAVQCIVLGANNRNKGLSKKFFAVARVFTWSSSPHFALFLSDNCVSLYSSQTRVSVCFCCIRSKRIEWNKKTRESWAQVIWLKASLAPLSSLVGNILHKHRRIRALESEICNSFRRRCVELDVDCVSFFVCSENRLIIFRFDDMICCRTLSAFERKIVRQKICLYKLRIAIIAFIRSWDVCAYVPFAKPQPFTEHV